MSMAGVYSTEIFFGAFRYVVNDDHWKHVDRESRTHEILGFCEIVIRPTRHVVHCNTTCLFCAACRLGIHFSEILKCGRRVLMYSPVNDEHSENVAVIDNWKNGFDANGIPLESDVKSAKIQ